MWPRFVLLATAAVMVQSVSGQVPSTGQPSITREQRQQIFLQLSKKIFAEPDVSAAVRVAVNNMPEAQVAEITSQLHELIVSEIEDVLAGPNPSDQKIVKDIQDLLGAMALANWDAQTSNAPFAKFFDLNGTHTLAVAYGMLRGGGALPNSHSYVEFYARENEGWGLKATTESDFDGRTFSVSPVDAGLAGQAWILAWGKTFGDTGSRLKVVLYAFDGLEIHPIWQREGLTRGSVTVSDGSVTLEYDREYHSSERVRDILHVTTNGFN